MELEPLDEQTQAALLAEQQRQAEEDPDDPGPVPGEEEPEPEPQEARYGPRPGPGAFRCPDCGRGFESQRGLSRHITDIHGRPSANSSRQKGRGAQAKPKPSPKRPNTVQTGMFLAYRLAGAAFATFGPPPETTRQVVGGSMILTAGPAAGGLDRVARRTPFYGLLETVFSGAGVIEDLSPLGVPLFLGFYGYAREEMRQRMRPMVQEGVTLLLAQMFGVEMPIEQAATEATQGIEPTPEGMKMMAEALLGQLDMAASMNHGQQAA